MSDAGRRAGADRGLFGTNPAPHRDRFRGRQHVGPPPSEAERAVVTAADLAPVLTIDALGRKCPIPIIMLAEQIRGVPLGAMVAVLADDPAAYTDVPSWCVMKAQEFAGTRNCPAAGPCSSAARSDPPTGPLEACGEPRVFFPPQGLLIVLGLAAAGAADAPAWRSASSAWRWASPA